MQIKLSNQIVAGKMLVIQFRSTFHLVSCLISVPIHHQFICVSLQRWPLKKVEKNLQDLIRPLQRLMERFWMKMNTWNLSSNVSPATTVALVMSERNKWLCAGYRVLDGQCATNFNDHNMLNNRSGAKVAAIDSEKVTAFHLVTSGMGNSTKRRSKRRSLESENAPDLPRASRSDQREWWSTWRQSQGCWSCATKGIVTEFTLEVGANGSP